MASNIKNCLKSRLNPNTSNVLDDSSNCDESFSSTVTTSPFTIFVFGFLDDMELFIEADTRTYECLYELMNLKNYPKYRVCLWARPGNSYSTRLPVDFVTSVVSLGTITVADRSWFAQAVSHILVPYPSIPVCRTSVLCLYVTLKVE